MCAVFISDGLYSTGFVDEEGKGPYGSSVTSWSMANAMTYTTDVLVVDLDLSTYAESSRYGRKGKQITNNKDHFREAFSALREQATALLKQGGTLVVLTDESVTVPGSKHSGEETISSTNWLNDLGVLNKIGNPTSGEVEVTEKAGENLKNYLKVTDEKRAIDTPRELSTVLAKHGNKSIAVEVSPFATSEKISDLGSVIFLPRPITWDISLDKTIFSITSIAEKRIADEASIRRTSLSSGEELSNRILEHMFEKISRSLSILNQGGANIEIENESDLQTYLKAILQLVFEKVKPEEQVESVGTYPGGQLDFLLPEERVGIEVKKTRKSMSNAKLGEQIAKAKDLYTHHSAVDQLYVLVYDRGHEINAEGIEDLSEPDAEVPVFVQVVD